MEYSHALPWGLSCFEHFQQGHGGNDSLLKSFADNSKLKGVKEDPDRTWEWAKRNSKQFTKDNAETP